MYVLSRIFKHNTLGFINFIHYHMLHHHIILKTLLVLCKGEYMGKRIIITRNTRRKKQDSSLWTGILCGSKISLDLSLTGT